MKNNNIKINLIPIIAYTISQTIKNFNISITEEQLIEFTTKLTTQREFKEYILKLLPDYNPEDIYLILNNLGDIKNDN